MDLSETRKIQSVSTQNGSYFTGEGYGYYSKITTTEKSGDSAYIIWYQLWQDGQVVREVNSRMVIDVEYDPITSDQIPF